METESTETQPREVVVTPEVIMREIGPKIDDALSRATQIAANIKDDESRDIAIDMAEQVQDQLDILSRKPDPKTGDKGGWREQFYIPAYRLAETLREFCDPRIKQGGAIKKMLLAGVSDYNILREREARLARERAEAEARRIQEEADRKRREAEEAAARVKAAIEAEERRKKEAEAAEARRIQAEKEAKERREREAREAAAAETARKQAEEEEHRLEHAQLADDLKASEKVDGILENPTPVSPVLGKAQQIPDQATVALEHEQARKVAEEKARQEQEASEKAAKERQEAEAAAVKAKAEADAAELEAANAQAAAASAIVTRPDPRTTAVTRWKYDLDSDGTEDGDRAAFLLLAKTVADGRAPIEYLGFDPKSPTKFRPQAINADVTMLKEKFSCPGIKAYPEQNEQLRRRKVGGAR